MYDSDSDSGTAPPHGPVPVVAGVGCVVIGRNEAPRLRRCLESVCEECRQVIYVDSGSSDGSPAIARSLGVPVLELDPSVPFSAARARNEGSMRLLQMHDGTIAYVQFVDGDCVLERGWLAAGADALRRDPSLGVVTGRSREQSPGRSVFKVLCDIELDVSSVETGACGGVALMRASALQSVGGYDLDLSAGEEPELCLRLRQAGWRIGSLPVPMMRHGLAMQNWRQWWRRCARSGQAYFESWWKHRRGPERYRQREVARIIAWGGVMPVVTLAALLTFGLPGLACSCGYVIPATRAHLWSRHHHHGRAKSLLYACACVVGKLPEFLGILRSCGRRLGRRRRRAR